jgi:hypothetical protein
MVITPGAALDWPSIEVSRLFEPVSDERALGRASRWRRAPRAIALAGLGAAASGCVYAPAACLSNLEEGEIVITEIRGPQDPDDTRGQWFELFNATDRRLDLAGLRGTMRPLEGSPVDGELELVFIVR